MYNVYYYTMYIEKVCLVYVYCLVYIAYYCQKTLRDANCVAIGMLNFYFCPMHL